MAQCLFVLFVLLFYTRNYNAEEPEVFITTTQDAQIAFRHGKANPATDTSVSSFPMERCYGITLEEATVYQLQRHMDRGEITSVQLAECYRHRISQTDKHVRSVLIWKWKRHKSKGGG